MSKLSECVEILDYKRIPLSASQREKLKKIYPYYGAQGIIDYVEEYLFDGEYILVAEDGNNLKSLSENIATWAEGKFWVNNHAHILGQKKGYDLRYIYYALNALDLRGYITGSAQPKFNQENLAGVELNLPDYDIQKSISKILTDIDSKIANNSAICSDLESMAKLLYDYWFVQFDFPDENGKPYKSSGGKMVWNEELKREIPEGWSVDTVGKEISVIRGVSYEPAETILAPKEGYVPLLKSNNLQNDHLLLDDVIYVPKANVTKEQFLTNNSIFVTMSSGSTEHVGKTALIPFNTPYCYGAFCSKIEINPKYRCFISQFFLSEFFKKKIRTIVVGTSIKNISNEHLTNNLIAYPTEKILKIFEDKLNPIYDKLGFIIQENQELASLRDFLLPMLMNGQVKVGGAAGA